MKKIILASVLAAATCSSYAAETATMKVQGVLTNSSCTPTLSNGGTVDFGTFHLGDLSASEVNQLGKKDITLTINCTAPSKVSWNTLDDRRDSLKELRITNAFANGSDATSYINEFGIGKTAENVSMGAYSIGINPAAVTGDGQPKTLVARSGDGMYWNESTGQTGAAGPDDGWLRNFTITDPGKINPCAFTEAVFPLTIAAAIDSTTNLGITDTTQLDGQTTISLVYL
ncbi:DUF1120 domain-containing protein [Scandinavium manionii]|uniref:DUF1120 domain-containing protein n=1 Tax=Scandinavium manionii TaxID=2926520 RepID=UPI002165C2C2|nr:DUF1120 domain-containing protein [Scandinavium manionii]MCS2167445.1 DUF1120 domain-containing protein [Scandinavium manionii]